MTPRINLIKSKSILIKSGLPGSDWVINPYNGCLFGCLYCYAAQIARWKHPDEEWGTYLDVKINTPELLEKELEKLRKKFGGKNFGSIFLSSVTDPYVSMEAKYKLTKKCLEILAEFGYEGEIAILTKSPLVTRDIDILKKLKNLSVGFTVTTLDDKVSRFLEVKAPPVSLRIKALKKLRDKGIATYAFIGPLLPFFRSEKMLRKDGNCGRLVRRRHHFTNREDKISELLDKLEEVGVGEVWFEHINLSLKIKERLFKFLRKQAPELIPEFAKADTEEYRRNLEQVIKKAMKGRNLKMGLGKVIYHRKLPKKTMGFFEGYIPLVLFWSF